MSKFKTDAYVRILHTDYPNTDLKVGEIRRILREENGGHDAWLVGISEGKASELFFNGNELELAKETKVTEFQIGDVVKVLRNRNGYGRELSWLKDETGKVITLGDEATDINDGGELGDWTPFTVVGKDYWVRSDDIELVSRKSGPISLGEGDVYHDIMNGLVDIDWEEALFGNHETEVSEARYRISRNRIDDDLVSLKIKKDIWWTSDDLIELGSHILALAEYLETGTVDLSDDCIECENEHLRDSNERLASANEAKRQRLAKIRELTEV